MVTDILIYVTIIVMIAIERYKYIQMFEDPKEKRRLYILYGLIFLVGSIIIIITIIQNHI